MEAVLGRQFCGKAGRKGAVASAWAWVCGVGAAGTLRAVETVTTLEAVEVTAKRGIDADAFLPATVTAYDGAALAARGIATFDELAPWVPGLFASNQSVDNVALNIRGLTSDSLDPRRQPRVSVFQDGVLLNNTHGSSVAFFDLADVAVFKGPQPTRFGEGVQSGALSLTANRARNESAGAFTVGVGEFNASTTELMVNRPVVADRLFVRAAVFTAESDGYVKNLADGSGLQGEGTVAFRGSLRWQPTTATTVDLIFNHQEDDTPGVAFKSASIPVAPGSTDTSPYTAANLNRGAELGVTRTITGVTGIVSHKVADGWTLVSTSSWRETESRQELDADGSYLYLFELGDIYAGRRLSEELRIAYDQGGALTASAGVNVARSEDAQTLLVRSDENALFTYFTGVAPPVPLNARYVEQGSRGLDKTSGDAFGRADYQVTDKLTVGGGLRVTRERIDSRYESFRAPVAGRLVGRLPTSGDGNNFFKPTSGPLEQSEEVASWAGQLDARYAVTPRLTTYASATRGRRPPVLDFHAVTLAPQQQAEETVVSYEAGVSGASADRRIGYDAAVFLYSFENFQTQRLLAPGVAEVFDGGRARGRGLELSAHAEVARGCTVFGSYGFTDAQFSALDEDGLAQLYAGNTFRLTSRHVVSFGGTVTMSAGGGGSVFITPQYTYRSAYFFEDDNAQNGGVLRQGGFGLVSLRIGYRPTSGWWEVAGFVDNLAGKDYLLDAGNIGGRYGIPTMVPAAPRTVGIKATVRF